MPSLTLNKETIAFAAGLIGLTATGLKVYDWLLTGRVENSPIIREMTIKNNDQDTRLDRTDRDRERNTAALKEQTAETTQLKEAVIRLTAVIEANGITKRAEYIIPPAVFGSKQSIALEERQ